jgi:tRNA A37 threonylcarbamoyltransferase TsaD
MIAFAAALRWKDGLPKADATFSVRPRWELSTAS